MSLSGARNSAVSGLKVQSTSIAVSADNIANSDTSGYKATKVGFSTLVTTSSGSGSFNSGGVSISARSLIEKQGLVQSTGRATDLAISGNGFFTVKDDSGNLFLTRAGSFDINSSGELQNISGYNLLGWPLDPEGRRPGEPGNLNTVASESVDSLEVIDTNAASGTASPTTTVSVRMNLDASEESFQGATAKMSFLSNGINDINAVGDIIVPEEGLQSGNKITFVANDISTTYCYGGFSSSRDISSNPIFGIASPSIPFISGEDGLANNDKFTISSEVAGTSTYVYVEGTPNVLEGEFNSFDTLADAINSTEGLTARVANSRVYVSSEDANNSIIFGDVSGSNLDKKLGFSSIESGDNRFSTLLGLSSMVNKSSTLGSKVNNPSSSAELEIFSIDPLDSLRVEKEQGVATIDLTSSYNGNIGKDEIIVPFSPSMIPELGNGNPIGSNVSNIAISTEAGGQLEEFSYGGIASSNDVTLTSILGVSTVSDVFSAIDNDIFAINDGTVDYDLTFVTNSPDSSLGEFNSLETLSTAINSLYSNDLRSRIEDNKIFISSTDADLGLTFINKNTTDFVSALGVNDFAAKDPAANSRFNTLEGLKNLINSIPGVSGSIGLSANNPTIDILAENGSVQDQLTIDGEVTLLSELGLSEGSIGDGMFKALGVDSIVAEDESEGIVESSYDPTNLIKNLSSEAISPDFATNVQIFDSLGTSHNFRMSFLKIKQNEWQLELYSLNPEEISGRQDGQIVSGTVEFNGDGTLKSLSQSLTNELSISWLTGASPSSLTLELGTAGQPAGTNGATIIGQTDGIRQFDSDYDVESVIQNGVAAGQFNGIAISPEGIVNALFSNGEVKPIFQLPLGVVPNQNGLEAITGNVFSVTQVSGEVNLRISGFGGAGEIVPGSLEGSTTDIAEELTATIGIQASYNANANLVSTVRDMEEELNRRL